MAMHPTLPSLPLPQSLLQLLLLCCCPGGARAPLPPLGEGGHKLTYFEFAGRAESIRIALFAAGIDFQDDRVKYADYQTMKADTDDCEEQRVPASCHAAAPADSTLSPPSPPP